jgi:hypothetical protein
LGNYAVSATDTNGKEAHRTLRVIPRLLLNDYSGRVGATVRVYCYGFVPGEQVHIWWYMTPTSHSTLKTISIASNGRGSTLITIPEATLSKHMLRCQGAGHSATDYFSVTAAAAAEQPTATATPSPTPTATGTPEPTLEPSPTETPAVEATPDPTGEASPEPAPTDTPTVTPSPTETATPEPTPTDTPIPTEAPIPGTPDAAAILKERFA